MLSLAVYVCLYAFPLNNFCAPEAMFMKLGFCIMPPEAIPPT
jgi:hypothetical protein